MATKVLLGRLKVLSLALRPLDLIEGPSASQDLSIVIYEGA